MGFIVYYTLLLCLCIAVLMTHKANKAKEKIYTNSPTRFMKAK